MPKNESKTIEIAKNIEILGDDHGYVKWRL